MALKALTHPVTGQTFYMGRNKPTIEVMSKTTFLPIDKYINFSVIPAAPTTCSYASAAMASLSQIFLNDQLGDCVIAMLAHLIGVLTGNGTGTPFVFTADQIISLYGAIGGYVPGNPSTDNGCDEITALNHLVTHGAPIGHNKAKAYLWVDPTNLELYRQTLWLFENLLYGVDLPDAWVNPMPSGSGFVWDAAGPADPNNGHAFLGCGYTAEGIEIDTWGMLGTVTDAATETYCAGAVDGQLFCALSPEVIVRATQKAPSGFDWEQLAADFDAVAGKTIV